MKNFIYGLSLCAVFCLMGCASENVPGNTSNLLRYSVVFENVGLKGIEVIDMPLCRGQKSSIVRGTEVFPGFHGSQYPFNQVPDQENTLEWIDLESNEVVRVKVKIQLPKLFYNAEYPSDIIFHINSSTKQVQVAYKVFSPEKKDFILVDSEGKFFERYRVKFENVGSKKINVKDIILCHGQEYTKARCGELLTKDHVEYGCFDKIPDPGNTLEWTNMESKKVSRAKIKIELPTPFYDHKYLSRIIFKINSDTNKVEVEYEVFY